jgi:hypothetical protein
LGGFEEKREKKRRGTKGERRERRATKRGELNPNPKENANYKTN